MFHIISSKVVFLLAVPLKAYMVRSLRAMLQINMNAKILWTIMQGLMSAADKTEFSTMQ